MNFHVMKLTRLLLFFSMVVWSGGIGGEEEEDGDEKEKWKLRKTSPGLLPILVVIPRCFFSDDG